MRDFRSYRYNNNWPRRDFTWQSGSINTRQSTRCSGSRCIRFWRRLRMRHSSNGQTRWQRILWVTIKTFIANITKTKDIVQRTIEICGTTWNSWSERESWSSFYIIPVARGARWVQTPKRCFKTSFRHNKRHICSSREDRVLSFQNNVCRLAVCQRLKFRAKEG